MLTRRTLLQSVPCALLPAAASAAQDKDYPDKPIMLVVPTAAGGGLDISARAAAHHMKQTLGVPLIVDNRAGATGDIALRAVAGAAPDGYMATFTSAANSANEAARPGRSYPMSEKLRPVGKLGVSAFTLCVSRQLGVKTLEEFIAYTKARPGRVAYASVGHGSNHNLVMEMLCAAAGLDMIHVPYRGEVAAAPDLMEGSVQAMLMAGAKPYVSTGKVVGLATTNRTAWAAMPGLPPIASLASLSGFHYNGWNGLMVPLKTPDGVIVLLVQIDTVRERLPLQINHLPIASISSQCPFHAN